MDQRIDIEASRSRTVSQISASVNLIINGTEIRPDFKGVLDSSDRERKRPSTMGEGDTEFGKPLKDPAENHGTDRERRFGWHANQPRQPIFRHPSLPQHIPGMHEE